MSDRSYDEPVFVARIIERRITWLGLFGLKYSCARWRFGQSNQCKTVSADFTFSVPDALRSGLQTFHISSHACNGIVSRVSRPVFYTLVVILDRADDGWPTLCASIDNIGNQPWHDYCSIVGKLVRLNIDCFYYALRVVSIFSLCFYQRPSHIIPLFVVKIYLLLLPFFIKF